jgi:hypothetical protein
MIKGGLSVTVKWLALLVCIRTVLASNLILETGCREAVHEFPQSFLAQDLCYMAVKRTDCCTVRSLTVEQFLYISIRKLTCEN